MKMSLKVHTQTHLLMQVAAFAFMHVIRSMCSMCSMCTAPAARAAPAAPAASQIPQVPAFASKVPRFPLAFRLAPTPSFLFLPVIGEHKIKVTWHCQQLASISFGSRNLCLETAMPETPIGRRKKCKPTWHQAPSHSRLGKSRAGNDDI